MLNSDAIKASVRIEQIIGAYVELKKDGARYVALCPFHQEKTPSFYVTPEMGIYKCFGCDATGDLFKFVQQFEHKSFPEAVKTVAAMAGVAVEETDSPARPAPAKAPRSHTAATPRTAGVAPVPVAPEHPEPKLVATYPYTDAAGGLLYEVLRYQPGRKGKPKDFLQRRKHTDGNWVWGISAGNYYRGASGDWYPTKETGANTIYLPETPRTLWRLPAVLAAEQVFIVEGERDVLTLEQCNVTATTASGGSKQPWLEAYSEAVRGKAVVIIPDNDVPGEAHGRKIEKALKNIAAELVYVKIPDGYKDITEYLEDGRTSQDLYSLVAEAEKELREAEYRTRGLLSAAEVIARFKGGEEAFYDPSKREKGLQTGYHRYDDMTLGLHEGELTILAARPAVGKTSFALNVALNIARQRPNKAIAIFSLEMGSALLMQRLICSMSGIDSMKYRAGYCSREELAAYRKSADDLSKLQIFFDDYTPLDTKELHRKLKLFAKLHPLSLFLIDYIQILSALKDSRHSNRTNEVSEQSRSLKLICRELNVPCVALCQLSRACELRPGDHRPILSDLKDSGSLEQDADAVAFLYRQEMYRPDLPELRGRAELILAKQRNGPTGTIKLDFHKHLTLFDNPSSDWGSSYDSEAA